MSVVPINEDPADARAVPLQMYHASGERGGAVQSLPDFAIRLLACGDPLDCLYSYGCPMCALASARTQLDDSHCIYNFFCLSHVPERWMIRTAYDIPGSGEDDALIACFCFPCSANQLYQTTKRHGNPTLNGGRRYNKELFARPADERGVFRRFCCALFCNPCTTGQALQRGVGMPFWMGCCCTNVCTARNIIRYQDRITGHDFLDECVLPSLMLLATGASLLFLPLLLCVAPVIVSRSMQLQAQSEVRPTQSHRYLINDSIRQIPVPVHTVELMRPSVVAATIMAQPEEHEQQDDSNDKPLDDTNENQVHSYTDISSSRFEEEHKSDYMSPRGGEMASAEPPTESFPPSMPVAVALGHEEESTSLISIQTANNSASTTAI